jgi:hypothetical protein
LPAPVLFAAPLFDLSLMRQFVRLEPRVSPIPCRPATSRVRESSRSCWRRWRIVALSGSVRLVYQATMQMRSTPRILLTVVLALAAGTVLHAQTPTGSAASPNVPAAQAAATTVAPDSPRATTRAFLDAADLGLWDAAARFLSLTDAERPRAAELAERLKGVIDSRRLIDL